MRLALPKGNRSGFTLLEMVVSAALMALILVSAYLCLGAGLTGQKVIEPRVEVVQSARVAFALMTADLRSACSLSKDYDFIGMHRTLNEAPADNIDFATHNYSPRRLGEGDYCQVSYFIDKERKTGKLALYRRRNPLIALDPLSGGSREEIVRGLRGMKLEYFDGDDWFDNWGDTEVRRQGRNSRAGQRGSGSTSQSDTRGNLTGLPDAVRITLWFDTDPRSASDPTRDPDVKAPTMAFQTVTRLNLAGVQPPTSSSGAPTDGGDSSGALGNNPIPGPGGGS